MMKWLLSVVAILLIGTSSSYNVNEDIADRVRGGFDDPSGFPNYETETEEPVIDESVGGEFEDYDGDLDAKIDAMTDEEFNKYVEELDTEGETISEESNVTDVHTSLQDADSSLEDNQSRIAESPVIYEPAAVGLESEADGEILHDTNSTSDFIDGNYEDTSVESQTDESVGDGFEDYIDHLDTATDESVEDEFVEYVGNLDSESDAHADLELADTTNSTTFADESTYNTTESQAADEEILHDTNSTSFIDGNYEDIVESQTPTDESVGDGFEDYIDHLDSATDESVEDGFEEYIGDLDSESDAHAELADITNGTSFADESTYNTTELQAAADDSFNEGTAPPLSEGGAQTPNMMEKVDFTEHSDTLSTDSTDTELEVLTPEDRDEVGNSSSVPIDDQLVTELEQLDDIPNEKELVDDYINYNEGSLDEFESAMNQSAVPEGLQSSVQQTTHNEETETANSTAKPDSALVANSDTPLDTDTTRVTDSHQSNIVAYDNYDRESVNLSPYDPDLSNPVEMGNEGNGMSSDDSLEVPDLDRILLEEDAEEYSEGYEPPSEYGSDSYSDGPTYLEHIEEDLKDEINEVEADIPGQISQGNFYETEYEDYMEQNKFSLEDTLSSYHTITYFLSIVLLSVIVYVAYTNRHRFTNKRRNNYAYSRLSDQHAHQPLV